MKKEHKMGRNTADMLIHSCGHNPIKETYSLQYYKNKAVFERRGNSLRFDFHVYPPLHSFYDLVSHSPATFLPPNGRFALGIFSVSLEPKIGRYEILIKHFGAISEEIYDERKVRRKKRKKKRGGKRKNKTVNNRTAKDCLRPIHNNKTSESSDDIDSEIDSESQDNDYHWALHCVSRVEAQHWLVSGGEM